MKRVLVVILMILSTNFLYGQPLTGTKTIPGDYPTIQAAIGALNTNGVGAGGVTFNVAAGSTETLASATSGMIVYACLPAYYSSATSPVVFQKSGSGADPLITAFTPGTSATTDGIIILSGAGYITFDGIDLQENVLNTTPTMQMEWGFALVKKNSAAPFYGCPNVIIKNCGITLNKANTASTGIHLGCHLYNSTTEVYITSPSDANSNCKIYGNNISNVYNGISAEGFFGPSNLYDLNNEIGVTAANTITNFAGGGGNPFAIYASYQDNLKIAGNSIIGGTGTTGNLYGIYTGSGTGSNVQIYNNVITLTPGGAWVTTVTGIRNTMGSGGTTNTVNIYNNTLENFTPPTAASWPSYLILQESNAPTANIYGNIMRNCTHYGANYYYAIGELSSVTNGVRNIYNNQIYNITMPTSTTIYVIDYSASTTTTGNIYNNLIHGIYSNGGSNRGIALEQGGTTNVYKNRIYDISTDGNGFSGQGLLTGVSISATTTANIYNNYITDLKAPTTGYGYAADAIEGIYINTATSCNIISNTIYLNASSAYSSFRTACVSSSGNTIGSILLKNNILVNLSTSAGSGNFAVALRRPGTSLTNYNVNSDNNLFYSGIPSPNRLIFEDYTNADQTLAGFQSRVAPREAHSTSELPPFVNAAGYDFHLIAGAGTSCESGGQVISVPVVINDDYDGDQRFPNAGYPNNPGHPATAPDLGADEFAGAGDNTPPNIMYTPLTDPTDNNARILTAVIYDAGTGVPVSGMGLPMLYWKKTGDVGYAGVQGVSTGAGQYTFTFGGGVSSGNTVYYYLAAQDMVVPANVGVFPSTSASGFTSNPPAASTPPSNPSSYIVQSPLVGIWTIPGDFPTIQAAIATLSFRGVGTGGVTFNIAANYTETFTNANGGLINYTCNPSYYSSSTNPVVFQKSGTGSNPLVTAYSPGTSTTVDGIVTVAGGDYITFDGLDLQENPLNTTSTMQMEWGYALVKKSASPPYNGCQNVIIRNCNISLNKANTGSIGINIAACTANSNLTLSISNGATDANNNCMIYGNSISNVYCGISLNAYGTSISAFDLGNEVGVTAPNSITNFGGGTVDAEAIFVNYQHNLKIYNNTINGGTGTTANNLYGVYALNEAGANFDISGNTISLNGATPNHWIYGICTSENTSPNIININNNSIENIVNSQSVNSYIRCIYQGASGHTININGNIIRNISKPGSGYLEGIYTFYGANSCVESISNNQIYNLTSTGSSVIYGIENSTGSTGTANITGNVIHGISSSAFRNIGIYNTSASVVNAGKNRIYDITCNGGLTYGIYFTSVATANVYNNFISDLKAPSTNSGWAVFGLHFQDGTAINMFNNTVYLNASSSFLNFSTVCANVASNSSFVTSKNNILVNMSVSTGNGHYAVAFYRTGPSLTNYDPGSDNNLFYAGITGTNNILFCDNSNFYQTLSAFQAAVAPRETNSATEMPPFIDAANNNLHVQGGVETHCESGGQAITTPFTITEDYDGDARYPNTGYPFNPLDTPNAPDMGADEFGGGKYHNPPSIIYTPITNPVTTAAQVLTATISDPSSGVPTSGTGLPVLYWKINNAATYTPVQAVSAGGNQYSFTFGSGVESGDYVYYYIVAQGNWPIPNIGAFPNLLAGGYSANPPAVSTPPSNPSSYLVQSPLFGTISVNTAGKYPSLTGPSGLFQNINNCGLMGNLTAIIQTNLVEPGTYSLNTWTEIGAGNYTLTIQPDATTLRVISGTAVASNSPMINISGAGRVRIDGGSGKYLLFRNTNSTAFFTGPTIQFTNGATNDTLRNCTIENNGTTSAQGSVTIGSAGTNNICIANCSFHDATAGTTGFPYNAIYSNSATNTLNLQANNIYNWINGGIYLTNAASGCIINGNSLYETSVQSSSLYGIYVNAGSGHTITNNNFGGSNPGRTGAAMTTSAGLYGIYLSVGVASPTSVQGNTLSNFGTTGNSSTATAYGIYAVNGNINIGNITGNVFGGGALPSDTIRNGYDNGIIYSQSPGIVNIENNTIGNVNYYRGSNDRTAGMYITAGTVHVKNNIIRDFKGNSTGTSNAYLLEGIHLNSSGTLTSPVIEGNTISNIWNSNPGTAAYNVIGINLQTSNVPNAVVRNNKISNIYSIGTGTGSNSPLIYGIFNGGTNSSVYNNIVILGQNPGAPESRIYGIIDNGTTTSTYYFNSVNISGTGSGTNSSFAFYANANNTYTVKNNIFSNVRSGGSIKPCAIGTYSSGLSITGNYNDLYTTGTPLGLWGSTTCTDIAAWRTASSQDANSISGDPDFVSLTDLHINGTMGSPVSDAGVTIPSITTDFDYEIRNSPPDIGADDYTLPASVNTSLASQLSCTSATLNGTINPNNETVAVSFQYGTTTSYGNSAAATPATLSGTTTTPVSAPLTSLSSGTLYHYRAVGMVGIIPFYGSDMTFTTGDQAGSAGVISGLTSVCKGTSGVTYSVPLIPYASSYNWIVPAGATISGGSGSNIITVNFSAGAVSGNISVNGSNSCGIGSASTLPVTLNDRPVPVVSGPASACVNSTANVYATQPGMTVYLWNVSAGGTITSGGGSSDNSVAVTWNSAGPQTVSVSYTNTNGCTTVLPSVYNVTVNPLPVATISGPAIACPGSAGNVYTTEAGMTGYSWIVSVGGTVTSGGGSSNNAVTVTWNTSGPQTVSVSYTNANGCIPVSPATTNVNVNSVIVPFLTGPANACVNSTGNIYTTQAGMTAYTWSVSAGGIITAGGTSNSNTVIVTWNTAGPQTVTVNYTAGSGCTSASPGTYNVTVNTLPVPSLSGPSACCANSAGNVYTTQAGMSAYTWSVSPGGTVTAGGTASSNTINITWNSAGAQTVGVSYTNSNGCTSASPATYNINVNPLPVPALSGPAAACINSTGNVYTTQAGMTGYSWIVSAGGTITGGGTSSSSSATITWNSAGAQTVTVSYTNANGCTAASPSTYNVNVNSLPVPTVSGPATACINSTGNIYTTQAGMTGYTWNVSPGGTVTSGGTSTSSTVTVTWNNAGAQTVSVSYTNAAGCTASSPASYNVTVTPLPVPSLSGPITACIGTAGNFYSTQAGMTGYTWNVSAGGSITSGGTPASNTATVTWNTAGPKTVSVSYTNANGCTAASPASYNVTVNPLPVPVISGPASACINSAGNVYTTQAGMTGYTWVVSSGGTITGGGTPSSNTITVTWNTSGPQTVSVSYTNSNGCTAASATNYNVTVNTLPVPTLSGPASSCLNSTGNIYTTQAGMTGYSWNVSAGGTITGGGTATSNTATITWNTTGAQSVSLSYTSATGCPAATPAIYSVTVNPLPSPVLSGPSTVCASSAGNVYTTQAGMTGYAWTISAGGTITAGGNSSSNSATVTWSGSGPQWIAVNYINSNGCTAASPSTYNVNVNTLPIPTITGPASICAGSAGNVYTTQAGMTGYSWTISSGGTVTAGGISSSNTVTVTWNTAGSQTVSVAYTNTNGCTSASPSTYNITVNPLPVPAISGPASVCVNSTGNAYSTQTGMTGYTWNVSAGGTITGGGTSSSSTATVTWNTAGAQTVSVSYTNAGGCNAASPSVYNVSVNTLPIPTIAGPTSVCESTTGNVYTTQAGMTGYAWTISAGGTITSGSGTNTISVSWNSAGSRNVSVNYSNANGCTAAAPSVYNVTVSPRPVAVINGPASACEGSTGNIYSTQAGMTGYSWTISPGGTIISGTGTSSITVTWNSAGSQSVTVNYTNGSGCQAASPATYAVFVNPMLVPVITGPASVCAVSTGNVYSTQAGMTTYNWTVSSGGVITSGSGTNAITVTWNTIGAETVSVIYTSPTGCSPAIPTVYNVTVGQMPAPTITGSTNPCQNSGYYNYNTEGGMNNYLWTISSGGSIISGEGTDMVQVSWNSAGVQWIAVDYTNQSGCTATSPTQLDVTTNPLPDPAGNITGTPVLCAGTSGVVYSCAPINNTTYYVWQLPAGASIVSGDGTTTVTVDFSSGASTGNIIVYGNNLCGNGNASSPFSVTVNPVPATPVVTLAGVLLTSSAANGNQWYYSPVQGGSGTPLPGATSQSYTANQDGWFWTEVTLNGCSSDSSNHVYVGTVGMQEPWAVNVNIYPVPNNGKFIVSITLPSQEECAIRVMSNLGVTIFELRNIPVNGHFEQPVDLGYVPSGVYFVEIKGDKSQIIRKVVVGQ